MTPQQTQKPRPLNGSQKRYLYTVDVVAYAEPTKFGFAQDQEVTLRVLTTARSLPEVEANVTKYLLGKDLFGHNAYHDDWIPGPVRSLLIRQAKFEHEIEVWELADLQKGQSG